MHLTNHPYATFSSSTIPNVWFEDGNLVIIAGDKRFRVPRGIIASKSCVFEGMLALPQSGPEVEREEDGCPIVRVHDSPQDMGWFLKAIYDSSFFEPPPSPTHVAIIASILRMSTKYDVPYLRRRALKHLELLYPITLEAFDLRQEQRTTPWTDNTAFFVSNLACEFNLLWLLPSCLLCICSCPVENIADGFTWNKNTTLHLDSSIRLACLKAVVPLANIEHRQTLEFLTRSAHSPRCKGVGSIGTSCDSTRLNILHLLNESRTRISPLDGVFRPVWDYYQQRVCDVCFREGKTRHEAGRRSLWESLPELFGLPKWEVLIRMRNEELDFTTDSPPY